MDKQEAVWLNLTYKQRQGAPEKASDLPQSHSQAEATWGEGQRINPRTRDTDSPVTRHSSSIPLSDCGSFLLSCLFICLSFTYLAVTGHAGFYLWQASCSPWHVGSSSLTREGTPAPCIRSAVLATGPLRKPPSCCFYHPCYCETSSAKTPGGEISGQKRSAFIQETFLGHLPWARL